MLKNFSYKKTINVHSFVLFLFFSVLNPVSVNAVATGCWAVTGVSYYWSSGCTEGSAVNSSSLPITTPQGIIILPSEDSNPGNYPNCAAAVTGGTINTTTYIDSICHLESSGSSNSYACGGSDGYTASNYYIDGGTCTNNFPATPIVSGQNTGNVNFSTSNFVIATDPEGDQLYYEIDWDGNGTVDGTTGVFASGISVPIGHTYTLAGTYGVRARAIQSNDPLKKSLWSPAFTISIGASFNCEAASFNPPLNIISNNSLLGVALNTGMRWYHNIFNNSNAACFRNTSGNNYFVPTKTQTERDSFMNNLPSGVTKGGF